MPPSGPRFGQCYDAIESLAGRMDATSWHARSLCPDWDMRDVIAHLGMMERVMTGRLPESADDPAPLDRIGPYRDEMAALDDAAFAARIGEIFVSRRADRHRECIREPEPEPDDDPAGDAESLLALQQAAARRADDSPPARRTWQRRELVQALRAQGNGIKPIARETGLAVGDHVNVSADSRPLFSWWRSRSQNRVVMSLRPRLWPEVPPLTA